MIGIADKDVSFFAGAMPAHNAWGVILEIILHLTTLSFITKFVTFSSPRCTTIIANNKTAKIIMNEVLNNTKTPKTIAYKFGCIADFVLTQMD